MLNPANAAFDQGYYYGCIVRISTLYLCFTTRFKPCSEDLRLQGWKIEILVLLLEGGESDRWPPDVSYRQILQYY
jgi:hypothetical protein